jgi:hypothetical protein
LPREHVERLDERELGERCALDDLVRLRSFDYGFERYHDHCDYRVVDWCSDVD